MAFDEIEYIYAFDPRHPRRGDQLLERLGWCWNRLDVAWERGNAGQWTHVRTQTFADVAEREQALDLETERWTALGLETTDNEFDIMVRCSARELQLEQDIRASDPPDDALAIYADWLQREGDPRGLVAALDLARACATEPGEREQLDQTFHAALIEHRRHLFGPLADRVDGLQLDWAGGHVVGLDLSTSTVPGIYSGRTWNRGAAGMFELPIFACLRSVKGGPLPADPVILAGLREIDGLGAIGLGLSLPRLERLRMGAGEIARLPRLRVLELHSSGIDLLAHTLGGSELPNLRELVLRLRTGGARIRGPQHVALAHLLELPIFASLRRLGLVLDDSEHGVFSREIAQAFLDAPVLRSIAQVELRSADFAADAQALLFEHSQRWPNLRLDST